MAAKKLHVKKDDMVKVIAGKEKGKTGKVTGIFPDKGRVVVEKTHPTKSDQCAGGHRRKGSSLECLQRFAAMWLLQPGDSHGHAHT
jgi:ribosomal protein L24